VGTGWRSGTPEALMRADKEAVIVDLESKEGKVVGTLSFTTCNELGLFQKRTVKSNLLTMLAILFLIIVSTLVYLHS
jgi:hypothetical protein